MLTVRPVPCQTLLAYAGSSRQEQEWLMILELAVLNVRPELVDQFEDAFKQASQYIAAAPGYVSHELQRCIEDRNRYLLLARWRSIEDHTEGFRGSEAYQEWRRLLHHFYDPFPTVEHYELAIGNPH